MIQRDVLTFYSRLEFEEGLKRKLKDIASLGMQMTHLIVCNDIQSVDELHGLMLDGDPLKKLTCRP